VIGVSRSPMAHSATIFVIGATEPQSNEKATLAIEHYPVGTFAIQPIAFSAFSIADESVGVMPINARVACAIPLFPKPNGLCLSSRRPQSRSVSGLAFFAEIIVERNWRSFFCCNFNFTRRNRWTNCRLYHFWSLHYCWNLCHFRFLMAVQFPRGDLRFGDAASHRSHLELYPWNAVTQHSLNVR
jgi:hypothetical protein